MIVENGHMIKGRDQLLSGNFNATQLGGTVRGTDLETRREVSGLGFSYLG